MMQDPTRNRTMALWQRVYAPCSRALDRAMLALLGKESDRDQDFDANAD